MTDDIWRRAEDGDDDFTSEFGRLQFADEQAESPVLSFGDDTSGSLPHWSEPATGEMPQAVEPDVWDTFNSPSTPARRPGRLVIGTDPTGEVRVPRDEIPPVITEAPRERTRDVTDGYSRPTGRVRRAPSRSGPGRDLPSAISTGLVMLAVFIGATVWRPAAVLAIVVAVLTLAAVEFFGKVTEKGYRPATIAGLLAAVCAPLAAYWQQERGLLLVVVFAFMAASIGFIGSGSVQSGPMPNTAVTTLAVVWVSLLGSYAAMILSLSVSGSVQSWVGTDTLFIVVAGVVANDVGALVVGSAMGRTPLREWISPNKSMEGAVGGFVFTGIAVMVVGTQNGTWDKSSELLVLALVISVFAPLGDLVESMFKRNLDVKDFGTMIAGHGGVLDRFDGFLFVLPATYYLTMMTEPWL
jgi:phosphatidate cytidylyltransferase